jgi:poly-beta-1,6-N-acetyl-D-glucosamine N-deacetylase
MCWRSLLAAVLAAGSATLLAALAFPPSGGAAESAVVVMYHRFGEDAIRDTNTPLAQFDLHLEELKTGGYSVLPLPEIVAAVAAGRPLPDRAVGITIDDAFASVYREAWPRLRAAGFPFTVFVSTDAVDRGGMGIMTWDQIRELAAAGVTIGHHGAAHAHMAFARAETNSADIAKATGRFVEELGRRPDLFAYPYGEYSRALRAAVEAAGFVAAFGQHSGVAWAGGDMFAWPRFALNERWGEIERFRLIASALPLPVVEISPADMLLGPNPPPFGFTVTERLNNLDQLRCYDPGGTAMVVERLGERRLEARLASPFPPGRARINCTMPGPEGRWRWFGVQFVVPPA